MRKNNFLEEPSHGNRIFLLSNSKYVNWILQEPLMAVVVVAVRWGMRKNVLFFTWNAIRDVTIWPFVKINCYYSMYDGEVTVFRNGEWIAWAWSKFGCMIIYIVDSDDDCSHIKLSLKELARLSTIRSARLKLRCHWFHYINWNCI